MKAPEDGFDVWDPANVSPFVAYLATADCPFTGETFLVQGGTVQRVQSWTAAEKIDKDDRWTVAELAAEGPKLARPPKADRQRPPRRCQLSDSRPSCRDVHVTMSRPAPCWQQVAAYRPKTFRRRNRRQVDAEIDRAVRTSGAGA